MDKAYSSKWIAVNGEKYWAPEYPLNQCGTIHDKGNFNFIGRPFYKAPSDRFRSGNVVFRCPAELPRCYRRPCEFAGDKDCCQYFGTFLNHELDTVRDINIGQEVKQPLNPLSDPVLLHFLFQLYS